MNIELTDYSEVQSVTAKDAEVQIQRIGFSELEIVIREVERTVTIRVWSPYEDIVATIDNP